MTERRTRCGSDVIAAERHDALSRRPRAAVVIICQRPRYRHETNKNFAIFLSSNVTAVRAKMNPRSKGLVATSSRPVWAVSNSIDQRRLREMNIAIFLQCHFSSVRFIRGT